MSESQPCGGTNETEHHKWLQRMVGSWTYEMSWISEQGGETGTGSGTEIVRSFGGLWIIADGKGSTPDGAAMNWMLTLGFDPQRSAEGGLVEERAAGHSGAGRYLGTFHATVMAGMFVYDGERDGDVLTLDTEGPSMTDPEVIAPYRDVIELQGDDVRVMTSHALTDEGEWFAFMRGEYRREA